jgi:hypothetical protein
MEKKKALNPNAARGTPVAVPRWRGQLSADVLIAAAKAEQPPNPEQYEYKQSMVIDPEPLSYAWCRGKYPTAKRIAPRTAAIRGPLESTSIPTGIPSEY